ncbi:MAG: hypothetical protein J6D28_04860 [Bacilli bacterium]|nr:hypothetical protein [Bacilli bacterium]
MNENNELLMHINETADMGVKSTEKLLDLLKNKDNKIKFVLEEELKKYEEILKESSKLLKKANLEPKGASLMAEMMSKMEMKMDIKNDNSDSKVASILIQGFTMGTIEMNKKISDYEKQTDEKIIKLAKETLKFQELEIEKLKKFL